jgi:hypothetical protein
MWFEFRWWGFILHLDRATGCWAAQARPELEKLITGNVGNVWLIQVILGAIALYKWWIGISLGTNGVQIHFNWFGVVHWIAPDGALRPC